MALSPSEVTRLLCAEGEQVDGLMPLPLADILHDVKSAFPGIIADGGLTYWEGGDEGMFELYTSRQHVHFCCRQLLTDHCNTLTEILRKFECPLYDPQEDLRFVNRGGT